jgi:hypothetical protein
MVLKPCPFCGKDVHLSRRLRHETDPEFRNKIVYEDISVSCSECCVKLHRSYQIKWVGPQGNESHVVSEGHGDKVANEVVASWNRRSNRKPRNNKSIMILLSKV